MSGNNKKGILLPPAVGYSLSVVGRLLFRNRVSWVYVPRLLMTLLINLVNLPFRSIERLFINRKILKGAVQEDQVKPPIFILGHWRSGTTHLHNILCQDPQMGYVTTFQSVFPDTLFVRIGHGLFKGFARLLVPGTRKGDNVTLGMDLPQEEEFALGDKTPLCYYYFWMFPRRMRLYYQRAIRFTGIGDSVLASWKSDYRLLVRKALINTGKNRFLSKNPPNTGRVKFLLEAFPGARFIHIHRNPVEVFLSTRNFYQKMMPHLQLQTIDQSVLDEDIFEIYDNLMKDYLEQRSQIPEGQLVEISFEELEKNPVEGLKRIYSTMDIDGWEKALPNFEAYLTRMRSYKKNEHLISEELQQRITSRWGFAMKEWGYGLPSTIRIKEKG